MDNARRAYETMTTGSNNSFQGKITSLRKRDGAALDEVERRCLEGLDTEGVWLLRSGKLKSWPPFFNNNEECGEEMQKGLMLLWSSYLVMVSACLLSIPPTTASPERVSLFTHSGTLLAATAIQPLISSQGLDSPKRGAYGLLWMLALLIDLMGMGITGIFLGYLLSVPGKLAWIWLCRIGTLRRLPTLILVLDTVLSLVALGYSVWTLYGSAIGVSCLIVEVSGVSVVLWVYWYLSFPLNETRSLELEEQQQPQPLQTLLVPV